MSYYLVKSTSLSFDAHGSYNECGVDMKVSNDPEYEKLNIPEVYAEDGETCELQPFNRYNNEIKAEDGYNYNITEIELIKITEGEAVKYNKIIQDYKMLEGLIK